MTPFPYAIEATAPLAKAREMMEAHDFHHLPVTDGDRLVGVVTQRDLLSAQASAQDVDHMKVADLDLSEAYVVSLHTPLNEVVHHMASTGLGATLVTRQGKLVGIVTVTDLARLLAQLLDEHYGSPEGPEIA
ncbi:MAG: CBS domain-containing protein [Myxococcales bacterium]|nr:CBS domain-containing protein [Myxococcales bacterium]